MTDLVLILLCGAAMIFCVYMMVRNDAWFPTRCTVCGRWTRRDHTRLAKHGIIGWTRVCMPCFLWLYGPQGPV
jgi:hypothetical protein